MRADSPQWTPVGEPATPAEADALNELRTLLPDGGLTFAWCNLSFIALTGRVAEVDVLLLTPTGLTVVELKGWHGRITGNQQTWRANDQPRPNPLIETENKAKLLKGLLERYRPTSLRLPFISAVNVMHGRNSVIDLDTVAATRTFGLDGYNVEGVPKFSEYLSQPATDERDIIDRPRAKAIVKLLGELGFTAPPRTRMVGQYAVDRSASVDSGPSWYDVIADHPTLANQRKRIRLYDVPRGASAEARQQVVRTAQREYYLTSGLKHPGVVAPEDFFDDPVAGPALVFDHDPDAVPLDTWLAEHGSTLTAEERLAILRQVAEVLRYAHGRHVTHRSLTPRQVVISEDAAHRVRIRDWQTGRSDPDADTTTNPQRTLLAGTRHIARSAADDGLVYLAPEALALDDHEHDGVALDVYGLGALGYLLLTDHPPAKGIAELQARIRGSRGLDPTADSDAVPEPLRQLILRATHPDASLDRTPSVDAFLADLDAAIRDLTVTEEPQPVEDPLAADAGDALDNRFIVKARLGSGSTGLALLVVDTARTDSEDDVTVLKVAHDATTEPRLLAEYDVLARLDHPRIVKPLEPPFRIGEHLVMHLEDAGRPTLGTRIRQEGRLTLDQLERYGTDLIEIVGHLDSHGVVHRDLKPDNLGVRPDPGDRRPRPVLFDFSLAAEPLEHIRAGTVPYLDPFLGAGRRPRFDRAAERFALAVTLFEMATATHPVWGSGEADPATIDEPVTILPSLFDDAVATGMKAFFTRALHRDAAQRFGELADLARAWSAMFTNLDAAPAVTEPTAPAVEVELSTPLAAAGLSARALSVLGRLDGVETVGDLLAVNSFKINNIPGIGDQTRREIRTHLKQWRRLLHAPSPIEQVTVTTARPTGRSVDAVAVALVPVDHGRNRREVAYARLLVGLDAGADAALGTDPWVTSVAAASALDVTRGRVSQLLDGLRKGWQAEPVVTALTDEVVDILARSGGVARVEEIGRGLLATRGSAAPDRLRLRQAIGLVRVVVETDSARGGDARFALRRIGDNVLLALEPDDLADPSGSTVLDFAKRLGDAADRLAARDPFPVRSVALAALRDVRTPDGLAPLPDDLLLSVAVQASRTAALGSRGEIYPRGLDAAEALRRTLAGTGSSGAPLTPDLLASRVRTRFPEAAALPPRPALDDLVHAVAPHLSWTGSGYTPATGTSGSLLSTQHLTALGGRPEVVPFDELDARLRTSLDVAGYLTLAVDPRLQDRVAAVLAERYGLAIVNLTDLLLDAARELAASTGVNWSFLLDVDALDASSTDRRQLDNFVADALARAWPAVLERPEPLLLTDAAPLGRYRQENLLRHLSDLATPRPAARWLLVPHRSASAAPYLDSRVPVPLGSDGFVTVGSDVVEHGARKAGVS